MFTFFMLLNLYNGSFAADGSSFSLEKTASSHRRFIP